MPEISFRQYFSDYSDMAIGVAKLFGYDLPRNFNLPFFARNIGEFRDRWHISLSSGLNECVFNPIALKFRRRIADGPGGAASAGAGDERSMEESGIPGIRTRTR